MTKSEWISACAYQFIRRGMPADQATESAEECLHNAIEDKGDEVSALATSPEEAAAEEMSYWEGA